MIGTERLMLEASGFDFRSRHPQVFMIKFLKHLGYEKDSDTAKTAWKVSLDLYRTFAPLKQTTAAMSLACIELAERIVGVWDPQKQEAVEAQYEEWSVRREHIIETLLDLLDVYTAYRGSTAVGPAYELETFLNIRIPLNEESERRKLPRYTEYYERKSAATNGTEPRIPTGPAAANGHGSRAGHKNTSPMEQASPASGPRRGGGNSGIRQRVGERGREGTVRFMLNPEREREERAVIAEYERAHGAQGQSR
jgi:CTD kinase subunit beta